MKRISYYTLSISFLTVGLVSCGKTTTRKMSNDWKVTSYLEKTEQVNSSGDITTSTISSNGSEVSHETFYDPSTGPSTTQFQSGTVGAFEYAIKKDGTWTSTRDFTYESFNVTSNTKQVKSGTWSFIGKTKGDDFKKNERILFNILSESETYVQVSNQVVLTNQASSNTYLTGEKTQIYSVDTPKKGQLKMNLESNSVHNETANGHSNKTSEQFIFEAK